MIPVLKMPYPDEIFFSWFSRLLDENGISQKTYSQLYSESQREKYVYDKSNIEYDFFRFYAMINCQLSAGDIFLRTSTFPFESLFMDEGLQSYYLNRMTRPTSKFNRSPALILPVVCPSCYKEDTKKYGRPYFHRAHHLTGVQVCYKHKDVLLKFTQSRLKKDICLADFAEPEIIDDLEIEYLHTYAIYAKRLLDATCGANYLDIRKALFNLVQNNYIGYKEGARFIDVVFDWKYYRFFPVEADWLYRIKFQEGISIEPEKLIPVLMCLFPNPEELLRRLPKKKSVKDVRCSNCGMEYVTTDFLMRTGWRCPECEKKENLRLQTNEIVEKTGNGEYLLLGFTNSKSRVMLLRHVACGNEFRVSIKSFCFRNQRCMCGLETTYNEIKRNINRFPGFSLKEYQENNRYGIIHHHECHTDFKDNVAKLPNFLNCPRCHSTRLIREKKQARMENYIQSLIHKNDAEHLWKYTDLPRKTPPDREWIVCYNLLLQFKEKNSSLTMPRNYMFYGVNLGAWCHRQRTQRIYLSKEKIELLNRIGFAWRVERYGKWENNCSIYKEFIEINGINCIPPTKYYYNGLNLYYWIWTNIVQHENGTLLPEREKLLLEANPDFFKQIKHFKSV